MKKNKISLFIAIAFIIFVIALFTVKIIHKVDNTNENDPIDTTYWAYRIASREYEVIRVSASSGSSIISNTDPMSINTDTVNDGDSLAFSINSILSLKRALNTQITTNTESISNIQSDLTEALNNRVTEAQVTTKINEALTWGTWGLEGQNYVLRKGTTVITNG